MRRLVRRQSFRELHAVSSEWMERHFGLIEADAPWLDRIGTELQDYCQGSARSPGLDPGFPVSAACTRTMTVVYGFDGPLIAKLDMLGKAVFAVGWGKIKNVRTGDQPVQQFWVALDGEEILSREDNSSGLRNMSPQWRPNETLSRPAGMEGTPPWGRVPLSPHMSVTCVSRGDTRQLPPPDHVGSRFRDAPRNYLLLDDGEAERHALEKDALESHEHALAVNINLSYYSNPNARQFRHRIPRYWLPTQARW